jgi:hypothetical protein
MELLSKMNDNICALGVSLNKRKHESIVSDQPSTNTAVSAKKAKTSSLSESVSDNESDSEALLGNVEQGHHNGNENTLNEDEQQPANMADVDDPLLDEIAQSLDETERTGDHVSDKLVLIANKRWNHKLSDDQLKEKAEKYPRPANCDKVVSPRVNPEIWAKLPRAVRGEDHKLFRVQTQLSTVTNLLVQATDMLLKAKSDPKSLQIDDLVRMNIDAVALVSHASHELAQRRREIIKPHLHRDQTVYDQAIQLLDVTPSIDLFASRLNYKCKPYVAFRPDPEAQAINAFHISWVNMCFYAFPLFCIINQVLQKISEEKATGIIVIPQWPTQSWWPYLTNMLINCPLMLPSTQTTLMLPSHPQKIHPLQKNLRLLMYHLKVKEFQKKLLQSSYKHGDRGLKNSTNTIYKSGNSTVVNEVSIPFLQI